MFLSIREICVREQRTLRIVSIDPARPQIHSLSVNQTIVNIHRSPHLSNEKLRSHPKRELLSLQ